MNEENTDIIIHLLAELGFPVQIDLREQLELVIRNAPMDFQWFADIEIDEECKMETCFSFHKTHTDSIVLNKYDALLRDNKDPSKCRRQTFYMHKGRITFKEAFNLLQGRAVYKPLFSSAGDKYEAWIQLNFEERDLNDNYKIMQFQGKYRYELDKVLAKYPIQELEFEESKAALITSLKNGDRQMVTFLKPRKAEKVFIEANPGLKTISIAAIHDKGIVGR